MVAEALQDWLPNVIQDLEPWVSSNDIEKGTAWRNEIARQLDVATVGIICLTLDNLEKPWLLFEAGAISKKLDQSYVCTYLLDLDPSDLKDPLAQFQATKATAGDTRKLLQTINRARGELALPQERIDKAFEKFWPDLEQLLHNIHGATAKVENHRDEREMIEEILLSVRNLSQISQTNKLLLLSSSEQEDAPSLIEPGRELQAILQEVKKMNRPLVQMALEEAKNKEYRDGKLLVIFRKDDALAKRVRDSKVLFNAIGNKLFGRPLNVEVVINPGDDGEDIPF